MTELLAVDELPYRTVIDLQAALAQFGDQSAHGEVGLSAPAHQPVSVSARDLPRLVATNLVRLDAAGPPETLNPKNGCADADTKLCHGLMTRQATSLHGSYNTFPKISRIGSSHPCGPPSSQHVESEQS